MYKESWKEMKERLHQWASKNGINIRIHNHPKTKANWDK